MTRDGAEMDRVAAAVAGHGIHIALGFSERNGGSLYLAQNCPGWVIGRVA